MKTFTGDSSQVDRAGMHCPPQEQMTSANADISGEYRSSRDPWPAEPSNRPDATPRSRVWTTQTSLSGRAGRGRRAGEGSTRGW